MLLICPNIPTVYHCVGMFANAPCRITACLGHSSPTSEYLRCTPYERVVSLGGFICRVMMDTHAIACRALLTLSAGLGLILRYLHSKTAAKTINLDCKALSVSLSNAYVPIYPDCTEYTQVQSHSPGHCRQPMRK